MNLFSIKNCIMILLIFKSLKLECAEGCLSCNEKGQCQLCDLENNWGLSKSICLKSVITNCKQLVNHEKCVKCQNGFFLDQNKCVGISSNFLIQNCLSYQNITNCEVCETDYFISSGKCQKVTNVISNCKINLSEELCLTCKPGYILGLDNKICEEIQSTSNCQTFSIVECLDCKEGFKSENNFLQKKYEKLASSPILTDRIESMKRSEITTFPIEEKCFEVTVKNCKVLDDFNTCDICEDGYYLENRLCVLNPKDLINFCFDYITEKECQSCIQGYFLSSPSECKPVILIPNCTEYSTTSDKTNCIKCLDTHFLKDFNICQERLKKIHNCSIYDIKKDICQTCTNNQDLTDDKLKCLPRILNCKKYFPNSFINTSLTCNRCNDTHYLENKLCLEGTFPNCERFRQTENICEKCKNEFYLDPENICLKHSLIVGCKDYDRVIKDKCNTCAFNTVLFTKSSKCLPVDLTGCDVHSTVDKCARCDDGYMLNIDHSCTQLNESLNCVRGEYDICKLCKKGFILELGSCVLPLGYLTKNCDIDNLSGLVNKKNAVCESCDENSIPLNYRGNYLCLKDEEMKELLLGETPDVTCRAFKLNKDGVYQCDLHVIPENPVVNELACKTDESKYVASFSVKGNLINVENVNFCGVQKESCLIFGPLLDQKNLGEGINYGCSKCDTDPKFFKEIKYGENGETGNTTIAKNPANLYTAAGLDVDKFYGIANFQCVDKGTSSKKFLGTSGTTTNPDLNCQYYSEMPDQVNKEMGCVKCLHKKAGIVKNYKIDNCYIYDEENRNCKQCIPGYAYDSGNKLKCVAKTFAGCRITYTFANFIETKCYNCADGFVLSNEGTNCTTARQFGGPCAILNGFEDKCETCTDKILDSDGKCTITPKDNCLEYDNTVGSGTVGHCKKCKNTFWIDTTSGDCKVEKSGDDCLIYDQTPVAAETNARCLQYKTKIPFYFTNTCSPVAPIENCKIYDSIKSCSECNAGSYFFNVLDTGYSKTDNCCVQEGSYKKCGQTAAATNFPSTNNCSKASFADSNWLCLECKSGYHFDINFKTGAPKKINSGDLSFDFKCVENMKFWSPSENIIKDKVDLVDNTENCDIYDFLFFKCVKCKDDYYNSNGLCCLTGVNGIPGKVNISGSCLDISTTYTGVDTLKNCFKVDTSNSENPLCLECNSTIPEFLTNGHCCAVDKYYSTIKSTCENLPSFCKEFDESNSSCKTCKDEYYKTSEFSNCCADETYSNGLISCINIKIDLKISNCKKYNRVDKICEECTATFSWDKFAKNCVKTEKIYENCLKIDTSPEKKYQCKECEETHFFHTSLCCLKTTEYFDSEEGLCKTVSSQIPNCIEHEKIDTDMKCITCGDLYYKVNSNATCCPQSSFWDGEFCVPVAERLGNCAYFDNTLKKCLSCAADYLNSYYLSGSVSDSNVTRCCDYGSYEDATTDRSCKLGTGNCNKYDQSGDCNINGGCKTGYYATTDACLVLPGNCLEADISGNCSKCSIGYYIKDDDKTCQAVDFNDMNNLFTGTYNCKSGASSESNDIKCKTCLDYYVLSEDSPKSVCCPSGYYFELYKGCVESKDDLCAEPIKPTDDNVPDCPEDKCFLNKDYCTRHSEQTYKLINGFFSSVTNKTFNYTHDDSAFTTSSSSSSSTYYEKNYSTGSSPCCEIGKYHHSSEKGCINIPILNCDKYNSTAKICILCKSNYFRTNELCCGFNQIYDYYYDECVDNDSFIDCTSGYYKSNGVCCKEKTYFDEKNKRCMPLFDQNCLESKNDVSCSKCDIVNSFSYDDNHVSILELNLDNQEPCVNPNIRKEIYLCVKEDQMKNSSNQILTYNDMIFTTNYCKEFDFEKKECSKCIDTAYKTSDYNNCCQENSTGITINKIKQCIPIEKLLENCFYYEIEGKKCKKCINNTFHLESGRCCLNGTFLNRSTMECDIKDQPKCLKFNITTSNCTECKEGSYFSKGHCCSEGKFWDNSTSACVSILTSCLKLRNNGVCSKCVSGNYLTNGGCCNDSLYWNGTACKQINSETGSTNTLGFNGCQKVDDSHNCTKCLGHTLSTGRCCNDGEYFDGANTLKCKAIVPDAPDTTTSTLLDCIAANFDGTKCTGCSGSKYVADYAASNCCDLGQVFSNIPIKGPNVGCSDPSRALNCLQYNNADAAASDGGGCLICATGYKAHRAAITDKYTCILDAAITVIPGCTQYTGANCTVCSDLPYFSASNSCTDIANCAVSASDKCIECDTGFVLDDVKAAAATATICIDDRVSLDYPNCLSINEAGSAAGVKCTKCLDNFYLDKVDGKCKPIHTVSNTNFTNCIYGFYDASDSSNKYQCVKCDSGYTPDGTTKKCGAVTAKINHCENYNTSTPTECEKCQSGYYLQNSKATCCKEGDFYDTACISIDFTKIRNCDKFNLKSTYDTATKAPVIKDCEECGSGYYKTNGGCCGDASGKVWNGEACVVLSSDMVGVKDCNQIKDGNDECDNLNDLSTPDLRRSNCLTTDYYLTNKRCCNKGYYWDLLLNNCVVIDQTVFQDCDQMDEEGKCVECSSSSSKYVSNGHCCAVNKYYNISFCDDNSENKDFPGCEKINNKKCEACKVATHSTIEDCCIQTAAVDSTESSYWDSKEKSCMQYPFNCKVFDNSTMECSDCITDDDYANPKECCPLNEYFDKLGKKCVTITDQSTNLCKKLFPSDIDNKIKCSSCGDTGEIFMDDKCSSASTYKVKVGVNSHYVSFDVIKNCARMNDKGYCEKCSDGYVKTGSLLEDEQVCCLEGNYFNGDTGCVPNSTGNDDSKTNCKIRLITTECGECESTHYLKEKKCCKIGAVDCSTSTVVTENCIVFSSNICSKCKTGYNLFPDVVLKNGAICCQDGFFFDYKKNRTACLPLVKTVETCDVFNYTDIQCDTCLTTGYKSDAFCCLYTKQWNGTTDCETFIEDTDDKTTISCNGRNLDTSFNIGTDTAKPGCVSCTGSKYLSDSGLCCDLGTGNKTPSTPNCVDISITPNFCNKWKGGVCTECFANNNMYNNICCADKQYYDTSTSTCTIPANKKFENCKYFDKTTTVAEGLLCQKCMPDYLLASDKKSCCKTGQLIAKDVSDIERCLDSMAVPDSCKIFNPETLSCHTCNDNFYKTDNICCADGKFLKIVQNGSEKEKTCETIDSDYPSCSQVNIDLKECKKCKATHKLRHSDKLCVKILANCDFDYFNPETELCTKCIDNSTDDRNYLTHNICCKLGEYNKEGICTSISDADFTRNTNCDKLENRKCTQCKDDYYLLKNYCVPNGSYLNSTQDGVVSGTSIDPNCLEFGFYKECTKCNETSGYTLLNLKDGKTHCLKITRVPDGNCTYFSITEGSTYQQKNQAKCEKCISKDFFLTATASEAERIVSGLKITGCEFYEIKEKLFDSTLNCYSCTNNHENYYDHKLSLCKTRTATNCIGDSSDYPIDSDTCQKCDPEYHLINGKCIANTGNCKVYDSEKSLCIECKENYSLFYEKINNNTEIISECVNLDIRTEAATPYWFPGYIGACADDATCADDVFENLSGPLEKLFSCHKCTEDTKIPFVAYQGGADVTSYPTGIQRWDLDAIDNSDDTKSKNLDFNNMGHEISSLCLTPTKAPSGFNLEDSVTFNFPDNCALGLVNSDKKANAVEGKTDNANLENLSIFCVACKPGYRPKRDASFNLHIYECELIPECLTKGKALNRCEACNTDHSWGYKNQKVDYTSCIPWATNKNCFSIDNTSSDSADHKCIFCKIGYHLNNDKTCVQYTPPYCKSALDFKTLPFFNSQNIITGLTLLPEGQGCSQCETGYVGLFEHSDNWVCTESSYLTDAIFPSDSTVYDLNCLKYGISSNQIVKCVVCKDNFVITINNKCVAKNSILTNCLIANNGSQCFRCLNTHIVVNYSCEEKNIQNCVEYISNPQSPNQSCSKCADTFYIKEHICVAGTTKNCQEYLDRDVCKKCFNGFSLVVGKDEKEMCYPVTGHENCLQYDSDDFQQNNVQCKQCENENFILVGITEEYICNPFTSIDNCIEYDKQAHIINSSYECVTCHQDYYLNLETKVCVSRPSIVSNCLENNKYSIKCDLCKQNYYLNEEKSECILNPEGIPGCSRYTSPTTCGTCDSNLYLYDNLCYPVPETNLIEHCVTYLNSEECQSCIAEKILTNNKCEDAINTNCATYINPTECATCKENFGIKIENDQRKCVEITSENNCASQETFFPFKCLECQNQYYLTSEDKCLSISVTIENCLLYKNTDTCSKCENSHLLSSDGKTCTILNISSNCINFKQNSPFCVLCEVGYNLQSDRTCTKNDASNGLIENCLLYNSRNGNCLVCESGFYQNNEFECKVWNQSTDGGNGNGNGDGNNGDNQNFVGISLSWSWFLVVVGLWF